jgi:hypothetical protein
MTYPANDVPGNDVPGNDVPGSGPCTADLSPEPFNDQGYPGAVPARTCHVPYGPAT